jgi:broad specificity phosphatase PhoE
MKRLILSRHGSTDLITRVLCGRMSGVHLNRQGREEAETLARQLAPLLQTSTIVTSPMERAIETAEPVARLARANLRIAEEFNECDFGSWTGLTFEALDSRPDWRAFNQNRSSARAPSGESLLEVQNRAVSAVKQLMESASEPDSVVFTHADVIRSVLCSFTGTPLHLYLQYAVPPASLTVFEDNDGTLKLAASWGGGADDLLGFHRR